MLTHLLLDDMIIQIRSAKRLEENLAEVFGRLSENQIGEVFENSRFQPHDLVLRHPILLRLSHEFHTRPPVVVTRATAEV